MKKSCSPKALHSRLWVMVWVWAWRGSASCAGGSLAGQRGETTQTHPSRDVSPHAGSLKCGFLMQLFDKYLSPLYCEAIRTASEVALLKRHHKNKTIWVMNVSIYFPLIRTLPKARAEAAISQSFG